jgi:O-antigen/teichoic acid export membrane protein
MNSSDPSPTVKRSYLGLETAQLSIGQGLKLGIQAAYFVLIARALGPKSYGTFAAMVALASLLSPFTGLGSTQLFIKNVRSGKHAPALCWGNGLVTTFVSGFAFTVLALVADFVLRLRMPYELVIAVGLADLVLLPITLLGASGFAAIGRMTDNAVQNVFISLLRLIAIAVLALPARPVALNHWAFAYLVASSVGTAYCFYRANRLWGRPRCDFSALRADASEGMYFSIGSSAATIYNDIDKIMLGKFSSFVATGIYAAAYRIIDVSMAPVRSLATAAYPRFFEKGVSGLKSTYTYALTLIARTSLYGILVFGALWLSAPILPKILGPGYAEVVPALRWLSLLPLLRCLHTPLADALSGAGHQRTRALLQASVAALNVGLNFAILPKYGWLGAAWTSLASDGLLVLVMWAAIFQTMRRSRETGLMAVGV